MAKLLRIQDYLLLTASLAGEMGEEMRLAGGILPKTMELKYGFVPPNFKRNSYLSTVSKLLSTGEINRKIDSKGNSYLELSPTGQNKFKRKFPILSLQKKKWDGNFMMVVFDIAEKRRKERTILRTKLKELGFGMLQESVWVSPYHFEEDFQEFVESNGLKEYVYVMSAKTLMISNYKDLVNKIWKLDALNNKYQDLLDLITNGETDSKTLWNYYFSIVIRDPMLPTELLPAGWLREAVFKSLQDFTKLARPSSK